MFIKGGIFILFALAIGVAFQNCAPAGSGGGSPTQATGQNVSACDSASISGAWNGEIMEQADTMTINSPCSVTSTYCQASSQLSIGSVYSGASCPANATKCGTLQVVTASTNGRPGCLPAGSSVNCQFAVFAAGTPQSLYFNCGRPETQSRTNFKLSHRALFGPQILSV